MPETLTTARLCLRAFEMEDLLALYERIASDGDVMRHLPEDPHQDLGETLAWLSQTLDSGLLCWAVTLDGELIGTARLTELEPKRWEVSVKIAAEFQRRGYGTEVLKELLRHAFEDLEAQRVQSIPFANNLAALSMLDRVGMNRVGILPDHYDKHGLSVDGVVCEVRQAAPALTANEYQRAAMALLNPALTKSDALVNGVMGLCGESGECIDLVKKHLHQGHGLDKEALKKELGDVAWYLAETAWALDIPLEEVLRGNLEKLHRRYPGGFTPEKSIHRN